MPLSPLKPGECHAGFECLDEHPISTLNLNLLRLRHLKTGARMLHLAVDDPNNLFAVGFRTPPLDSTGVAHILEHTVLCGSERYPVRDPFFAMLKRSLSTFMNALTASDWTLYPFATQNRKDFYNLMGVYLDAVFFPLLRKQDFRQEGHRIEFTNPVDSHSPLTFRGVVFNEMKGAMASPPSLLGRRLTRALFPTTTYGFNSGGEPLSIPDLSWEDLRLFHQRYYHPSNAWLYSYGNLDLRRQLDTIDRLALGRFEAQPVISTVPAENGLIQPGRFVETFPVDPSAEPQPKAFIQVGWLACDVGDNFERLGLNLLALLLIGNPGAPLYRALLESGLGANLAPGTGYHDDYRTTFFAAGLQDIPETAADTMESLIRNTLIEVVRTGFPRDRIDGALHRIEFGHREVSGDHYPYPLSLLLRLLGPWLHFDDAVSPLQIEEDLERLKQAIDKGGFLEDLIRRYLIENPKRVTLILRPDPDHQRREDEALHERLVKIEARLSEPGREIILTRTKELQAAQEALEDISSLPTLGRKDIPAKEFPVPCRTITVDGETVSWFSQPTNGIGYFLAHFSTAGLAVEQIEDLPLFCALLTQVGAAGLDFAEMAARIEAGTGGVKAGLEVLENPDNLSVYEGLVELKGKALFQNRGKLFGILTDLCRDPDFSDLKRLHTVLNQIKTSLNNSIPGAGHRYAARAAAAGLTPGAGRRENWTGLTLFKRIKDLSEKTPEDLANFSRRMQSLAGALFQKNRAACSITSETGQERVFAPSVGAMLQALPMGSLRREENLPAAAPIPKRKGWATPVPVNYVTRIFPTVPYAHPDTAPLQVLAKLLRSGFLHREIREKGGAYGGFAAFDPESSLFSFMSYRDPHLARTLKVYDHAIDWAVRGEFTEEQITEAILGVFSDQDTPLSPAGRGYREFANLRQGLTPELRNQHRQRLLAVEKDKITAVATRYLQNGRDNSAIGVLASEEALAKANNELGPDSLEVERLG